MRCALLVCMLLLVGSAAERPTIYVFTAVDTSGFVDADAVARNKAVIELTKAFAKSKVVAVATTLEGATITLEVTRTEDVDVHSSLAATANVLNAGTSRPKEAETYKLLHRFATLRVGAFTTELLAPVIAFPKVLPKQVEDWVKINAARLEAK